MHRNEMKLEFDSRSCNESFARVTVAAFMTQLNPTLEEVADVKTAVSEAVTNSIIHAYGETGATNSGKDAVNPVTEMDRKVSPAEEMAEKIEIICRIRENVLEVEVRDTGCGIADVKRAMEPMFTTKAECDRAGMGFAFMEAFMDALEVESEPGKGTTVRMSKRIARGSVRHLDDVSAHMEGRERSGCAADQDIATPIGWECANAAQFPPDGYPETISAERRNTD